VILRPPEIVKVAISFDNVQFGLAGNIWPNPLAKYNKLRKFFLSYAVEGFKMKRLQ